MLQNYSVSLLNVYSNPEKVYFLYMNKGDIFLNDVRDITLAQLKIVADKTGELFIQAMPDRIDRNKIYLWLLDNYEMNEVQELAACFIRLYNKDFEDGSFMFTENEFEGMKRFLVTYRSEMEKEDILYIGDLIRILEKGSAT